LVNGVLLVNVDLYGEWGFAGEYSPLW